MDPGRFKISTDNSSYRLIWTDIGQYRDDIPLRYALEAIFENIASYRPIFSKYQSTHQNRHLLLSSRFFPLFFSPLWGVAMNMVNFWDMDMVGIFFFMSFDSPPPFWSPSPPLFLLLRLPAIAKALSPKLFTITGNRLELESKTSRRRTQYHSITQQMSQFVRLGCRSFEVRTSSPLLLEELASSRLQC